MQASSAVFSQLTSALLPGEFARCVRQFPTARPTRGLSEFDHFLALCFGQLAYRESLRDIILCLRGRRPLLYHLGFRGNLSRTNLAYASRHRDWRLFQAVAQLLIRRAARLYHADPPAPDLPAEVFALDASIISLSLSLFPWGYYARSRQAAMKLHLLLSLRGNLPAWAAITEAHLPDMKILDQVPPVAGAYYVMDRGYLDFGRLFRLANAGAFFVVRSKHHVSYRVLDSRPVDTSHGLRCDQTIRLKSTWSAKTYPEKLRRVRVYNTEHGFTLELLTNQMEFPAAVIAELYRKRWAVELFFKWIKQHLRLRSFYGRSENAVRIQVWTAICAYLLVAIAKKRLNLPQSMNEILQVVSVNMFEQLPLRELVAEPTSVIESEKPQSSFQNCFSFND